MNLNYSKKPAAKGFTPSTVWPQKGLGAKAQSNLWL